MQSALTIANLVVTTIVLYYMALFALAYVFRRFAPTPADDPSLRFVVIVPARNEEVVIGETVRRLREIEDPRLLALIMDDGSDDATSERATAAADGDPRIIVHRRGPDIAGCGKGDVLNHAFRIVGELRATHPALRGVGSDQIVLSIVDADGWLSPGVLHRVAPYFADQRVGGVQIAVRIWNARAGFLARMQDIEFVAFCQLVNLGRDLLGSTGLGGNGQFVRYAALQEVGARPWSDNLTEDLDLTLRLLRSGWRNRFCGGAFVAQQGLERAAPFRRQRTRWMQGHYSCWYHIPHMWRRGTKVPLLTRLDVSLYLLLVVSVFLFASLAAVGLFATVTQRHWDGTRLLVELIGPVGAQIATVVTTLGPLIVIMHTYARNTAFRMPLWSYPGVFLVFVCYSYWWGVGASVRALWRLVMRKGDWVKTPRALLRVEDAGHA